MDNLRAMLAEIKQTQTEILRRLDSIEERQQAMEAQVVAQTKKIRALLRELKNNQTQILKRLDKIGKHQQTTTQDLGELKSSVQTTSLQLRATNSYVHRTAGARLLNTTELLEHILLDVGTYIDPLELEYEDDYYRDDELYGELASIHIGYLLRTQYISRQFRDVISGSLKLQKLLFMKADSDITKSTPNLALLAERFPLNRFAMILSLPHVWFRSIDAEIDYRDGANQVLLTLGIEGRTFLYGAQAAADREDSQAPSSSTLKACHGRHWRSDRDKDHPESGNWMDMLLVQPAMKVIWELKAHPIERGAPIYARGEVDGALSIGEMFGLRKA